MASVGHSSFSSPLRYSYEIQHQEQDWRLISPEGKAVNDILDDFSKPSWWVTVVIAGVLVNLLAAYAKPIIDKIFSKYSLAYRNHLERISQNRKIFVEQMLSDKIMLIETKIDSLTYLVIAISCWAGMLLMISVFTVALPHMYEGLIHTLMLILSGIMAVLLGVSAASFFGKFVDRRRILSAAKKMSDLKTRKQPIDKVAN